MTVGWEQKRLGEVCSLINRGVAPKYIDQGGVAVLNQKCVRDHLVSFELGRRHDVAAKKVDAERYIRCGDVLVNSTGTGTLGRVAQVRSEPPEPTTVDTHVTIVRPEPDRFYADFFGYMLILIEDEIARSGEGASGQTELARSTLQNKFLVSYPTSKSEQQRIVAILDEAFAGLATATANAEKNLQNARDLFESYLSLIFDKKGRHWVETRFEECLDDVKYTTKVKRRDFMAEGAFPIISQEAEFISGYWSKSEDLFKVTKPIVIFGDHTKVLKYVDFDFVLGADGVKILQPSQDWHPKFFFYALKSLPLSSKGYARHYSVLKSKTVWRPVRLEEQALIASALDKLNSECARLEDIYHLNLASLAELKQSILQKAFSGELTSPPSQAIKEAAE